MLILGDARALLRTVPTGSVDLICTDPPYRTIGGGNSESGTPGHQRPSGMLASNNSKGGFEHNDIEFREYLHDLYRVLKDPGHIYLMVNFYNLKTAMVEMERHGFKLHNLLVARKQNATPNRWYMKNAEYVIFGRKGAAFPINDCGSMTCHDWTNPVGAKVHPTEKTVELMESYILNSSKPGDVVMDPFMGAGATGVAALKSGRRFIGFESYPEYFTTACKRMRKMPWTTGPIT
jgi:DNA modification methylase